MGRLGLVGADQEPSFGPKMPLRHFKSGPNRGTEAPQQKELNAGMVGLVEDKAEKSQRRDSEAAQGWEAAAATPWLERQGSGGVA